MITYINSDNKQDYTVLFNKASAKLGLAPVAKEVGLDDDGKPIIEYYKYVLAANGNRELVPCVAFDPAVGADNSNADFDADDNFLISKNGQKVISNGITSLNEYFQHIEELAELAIGEGRSGSDPYFLRLPLDEPFFEINANTRGITVPGELSQVGVVGDKLAEILFFKIDRYYDAVDLDTRHIYIEWELPDGTRGISRDFLKDTQSEKDKIIFGWLIDDVLTAQIGTIRFAVRFVEWTDRGDEAAANAQLLYSFSSLPATISISDTLHYTLFEDDEELQYNTDNNVTAIQTFRGAFENANPDSTDETAPALAAIPKFVRNLDANATLLSEGLYTRNLEGGAKGQPEGSLKLIGEAYSPDSGSITYMFGFKAQQEDGTQGMATKHDFIEVTDYSDENRSYFIKADNGIYESVSQTDIEALPEGTKIYEKIAYAIATQPGYYKVNARNRVSGKKTNTADSYMLYIPYAAMPEVTTPISDHFVLSQIDYTKTHNANSQSGQFATSNITFIPGAAGNATITLAPAVEASDGTTEAQNENLSYQWYKNANIFNDDIALLEPIEGAVDATYVASEKGYYAVKINNHFNNDDTMTEIADAGLCRVTPMPETPVIVWKNGNDNLWDNDVTLRTGTTIPDLKIQLGPCDKLYYEWHKISDDAEDWDPVAQDMIDATSPEGGIIVNAKESEQLIPFKPNAFGLYYLILDVELNGAHTYLNTAEEQEYGIVYVEALQSA